MDRQCLVDFHLKCEEILSQFKRKRRDIFVKYGDTQYDEQISKLLSLTTRIDKEIRDIDEQEDTKVVGNLFDEYGIHDKLIHTLKCEFENDDKETWYSENFDNWSMMPQRQDCESYSLPDRLRYSECRLAMFDHLENEWKRNTFPTMYNRLEFF